MITIMMTDHNDNGNNNNISIAITINSFIINFFIINPVHSLSPSLLPFRLDDARLAGEIYGLHLPFPNTSTSLLHLMHFFNITLFYLLSLVIIQFVDFPLLRGLFIMIAILTLPRLIRQYFIFILCLSFSFPFLLLPISTLIAPLSSLSHLLPFYLFLVSSHLLLPISVCFESHKSHTENDVLTIPSQNGGRK